MPQKGVSLINPYHVSFELLLFPRHFSSSVYISSSSEKQEMQCAYDVTLRRVRLTTFDVEVQFLLHILRQRECV